MKVEIELINKERIKILERLLQLYLHDISQYFQMDLDSNTGLYEYDSLKKYFDNSNNYAYIIKNDNKLAGFMLIDTDDESNFIVQEMFVLNNYKGNNIGKNSISLLLKKYKGNWIIKSLPGSIKAEIFWTKTINELTNSSCNITHIGKYNRAVFTFNNEENE